MEREWIWTQKERLLELSQIEGTLFGIDKKCSMSKDITEWFFLVIFRPKVQEILSIK
jgi:hypothetical protein